MTEYKSGIDWAGECFSERFRYLMLTNGINADEIAKFVGVPEWRIKDWTRGIEIPSLSILIRIAKFFNVSLGVVVGCEPFKVVDVSSFGKMTIH